MARMNSRNHRTSGSTSWMVEAVERRLLMASITGKVIYDANDNGIIDGGEVGIGGWSVFIDKNNDGKREASETAVRSASDGTYTFSDLSNGAYRIGVEAREGWKISASRSVGVTGSASFDGPSFANTNKARLRGTIFNDLNGNGKQDSGEAVLAGTRVYIDANANHTFDAGERSVLADANGFYQFIDMTEGIYRIEQVLPSGYLPSSPTTNLRSAAATGGSVNENLNFADQHAGTIQGYVYDDVDGSGTISAGDLALVDVPVYLDANNNGVLDAGEQSTTSSQVGTYSFDVLPGQTHVRVELPGVAAITTGAPVVYPVTVTAGGTSDFNDFAVAPQWTATGFVFEDTNQNGIQDNGETALAGENIFIDSNSSGTREFGETYITTASNGTFKLSGIVNGTYLIRPELVSGQTITDAHPSYTVVITTSGQTVTGDNFDIFTP